MSIAELERLLYKGINGQKWLILTGWGREDLKGFHLTVGMCDDFGCSDTCRDFDTLEELLEYLQKLELE